MKKRRLLFLSANRCTNPYPVYPIGLSYLFSYLENRLPDFDIRIFDLNLYSNDQLISFLNEFRPEYLGVSFRNIDDVDSYSKTWFIQEYKGIIDIIKKTINTRIIIGGSAFSIFPRELFELFDPEFGIYGEGEESLFRLLTCLENNADFSGIEGLVYRKDHSIMVNGRNDYIKSLDLRFDKNLVHYYWDKSGMMNVQTKRGCPYTCIYCTYPIIEGSKVRTLDTDKIIETLTELSIRKKIHYVFFTDSVFNISNQYNIELAEKMIRANLNIHWGAYFSPHKLDEKLLRLFKEAGLTHIEFGTESLSNATLRHYGKHFTVEEVIEISNICQKVNIYFAHFMILGGYGETEESINEGFENSKKIDDTVFFPYIGMRIYPGTRLHQLALEEGYISPDEDLLEPFYYIAKGINYSTLKERAERSGRRWVFPDEDVATVMNRMRKRQRKGSLWHHLKK